jgi:hypothetical protein
MQTAARMTLPPARRTRTSTPPPQPHLNPLNNPPLQTGLPMTGLAVLAGEWRLKPEDRAVLNQVYLPWALRAGVWSADLMCLYYEKHLEVRVPLL